MKKFKERILEILKPNLYGTIGTFKDCANKIAELKLDVPSKYDIKYPSPITENEAYYFYQGVEKTLSEIKRRNK